MSTKRRGWFRFSLFAVAVFATLCCGYLGYYRGYQQGYVAGDLQRKSEKPYCEIYYVDDLVTPWDENDKVPQFDPLIDLIVSTVATETWSENGGGCGEVRPFLTNRSLVISNTQNVHEEIADLLEHLRRLQQAIPEATLLPKVREIAAGQFRHQILTCMPKSNPRAHGVVTKQFDAGINTIKKELGSASYVGASSDKQFPEWATGQRAAVWNWRGGQVYMVQQETLPEGEALILGWRNEDSPRMERVQLGSTAAN